MAYGGRAGVSKIDYARMLAAALAVLGLLSFGPQSGYDLKQFADASISHFYWSPAKSQVYSELRRLRAAGLVTEQHVEQENRPEAEWLELIDAAVHYFPQWAVMGTKSTSNWGYYLFDVTNQYILYGVEGGFLTPETRKFQVVNEFISGVFLIGFTSMAQSLVQLESPLESRGRLVGRREGGSCRGGHGGPRRSLPGAPSHHRQRSRLRRRAGLLLPPPGR